MAHSIPISPDWARRLMASGVALMIWASPAGAQAQSTSDPVLKAMHDHMVRGGRLTFAQMRRLADSGDSLAALHYGKRLAALGDADVAPDAVHYYAMALYDGRDGAIFPVLSLLDITNASMSAARLGVIERSILAASRRGNVIATDALASMYLAGKPFGPKRPEALKLLARLAKGGNGKAALDLGMLYLAEDAPAPETKDLAQTYLILASTSTDLSVRTMAENLMRQWLEKALTPPVLPEGMIQ